mgnify:CR=1 FL=1
MIIETQMPDILHRGKVRDTYGLGGGHLLMVATDRISAFDVVLPTGITDKGLVLNRISAFWFDRTKDIVPNHFICLADTPEAAQYLEGSSIAGKVSEEVARQAMVVKRAERLDLECIVRGYITGSAWKEYRTSGTMHGGSMPEGLLEADRLPEPVFTPSTKADEGHDVNISYEEAVNLVGSEVAALAREASLACYQQGAAWAAERGILIADTKFEFGMVDGRLVLADEVLTPDSSRFWPAEAWAPGATPPSFDKQPVRDHLDALDWGKQPPAPPLPEDVVAATSSRYVEAYERITGRSFADWPGAGG